MRDPLRMGFKGCCEGVLRLCRVLTCLWTIRVATRVPRMFGLQALKASVAGGVSDSRRFIQIQR